VKFTEKLRRLTEGKNKAELALSVKLKPTVISDYVRRGYAPRVDIALKIARALNVPLDWLADDSQDWPPPPASIPASLTAAQLASELGRRLHGIGTALMIKLAAAQKVQWVEVASELLKLDVDGELPKKFRDLAMLPSQISALEVELYAFDPHCPVGPDAPPEILKDVKPEFEISLLELEWMISKCRSLPGFSAANQLIGILTAPTEWRGAGFKEQVERMRKEASAAIERAREKENEATKSPPKFRPGSRSRK